MSEESLLEQALSRVREPKEEDAVLSSSPARERSEANVDTDALDRIFYDDVRKVSTEIQALEEAKPAPWPAVPPDLWAAYYKPNPQLVPEEIVRPSHLVNRKFLEKLLEDPVYQQTHIATRFDDLASALAALTTGRKLLEEIEERPELKQAYDIANQAEEAQQAGNDEGAEAIAQTILDSLAGQSQAMRRAVRIASEAGQEKANEVSQAMAGWGQEAVGDLSRMPIEQRLNLLNQLLTPRFFALARLIGRMRSIARQRQRDRIEHRRDEIHSITLGRDLGRVLPYEIAMLKNPDRRFDFFRRYTEGQLLQYDLRAREPMERGPMIVLVDKSGSMGVGGAMDRASAVALALADTASRQKRQAAVIHFDTKVHQTEELKPGERDIQKMIRICNVGPSGDTLYDPVFIVAMDMSQRSEYKRADVVLITDGICELGMLAAVLDWKKRTGTRIWSVLISNAKDSPELKQYSDRVWAVPSLSDDVAGEIFEEVA